MNDNPDNLDQEKLGAKGIDAEEADKPIIPNASDELAEADKPIIPGESNLTDNA